MISKEDISRIEDATDIVDLIGSYVKLKKSGSGFAGCCPFHNEKTPSFNVSPAKQIYKCFGCGKGGDAVQAWMLDYRKPSRLEAEALHAYLKDNFQVEIIEEGGDK